MLKKTIACLLLLIIIVSCKSLLINRNNYSTSLLSVQNEIKGVLNEEANILLSSPLKVSHSLNFFDKKSFAKYSKINKFQKNINFKISYVDSIKNKPTYLKLNISDKLSLLEAINNQQNKGLRSFLALNSKRKIVTSISLSFEESKLKAIQNAKEIFIAPYGKKSFALHLFDGGKLTQEILFHDAVIFDSDTSSLCWQENKKHQLSIVDLIEGNSVCPPNTYENQKKAIKKVNYFKF